MKLEEAYGLLNEIQRIVRKFEDRHGYLPQEFDLNNPDDAEEKFKNDIARSVMSSLEDVRSLLDWVNKPIKVEGQLVKNSSERYEVKDIELTSGYPLDVYIEDDQEWSKSRIEHNGNDYYIVALGRETNIEGVLVRLR